MSDRPSTDRPQIALEDLLRLKKAERPTSAFWAGFERELRQKQLAALVERKTWWHGLAAAFGGLGRLQLPASGAAVLAVTFISINYYQTGANDFEPPAIDRPASIGAVKSADRFRDAATTAANAAAVEKTEKAERQPDQDASDAAPATKAPKPASGQEPVMDRTGTKDWEASDLTPSARFIAANLASVAGIAPDLVEAGVRAPGFEERALSSLHARHAVEMLPTAADAYRSRLPVAVLLEGSYAPEPTAPEHAKKRTIRYLTEDGLDRKISRWVPHGDRFSIKL